MIVNIGLELKEVHALHRSLKRSLVDALTSATEPLDSNCSALDLIEDFFSLRIYLRLVLGVAGCQRGRQIN